MKVVGVQVMQVKRFERAESPCSYTRQGSRSVKNEGKMFTPSANVPMASFVFRSVRCDFRFFHWRGGETIKKVQQKPKEE